MLKIPNTEPLLEALPQKQTLYLLPNTRIGLAEDNATLLWLYSQLNYTQLIIEIE